MATIQINILLLTNQQQHADHNIVAQVKNTSSPVHSHCYWFYSMQKSVHRKKLDGKRDKHRLQLVHVALVTSLISWPTSWPQTRITCQSNHSLNLLFTSREHFHTSIEKFRSKQVWFYIMNTPYCHLVMLFNSPRLECATNTNTTNSKAKLEDQVDR